MSFPASLQEPVGKVLQTIGDTSAIRSTRSLGGGCINNAVRLETVDNTYLLKWNPRPLPHMFPTEAKGLELLHATQTVLVPKPYGASDATADHPSYILMEWVEGDGGRRQNQEMLGHQLALMHRQGESPQSPPAYGLDHDNYIGSTPQYNGWDEDWVNFYREKRLRPQIELAQRSGRMNRDRQDRLERVLARMDEWLAGVKRQPALIHGDLWGGNVMTGPGGRPAIIDPAVYYSDREAEIAYTELFGGFSSSFYHAYNETWPLEPGYEDRRDLYNLYHLLNHLNLFGESYGYQVDAVARRYAT